VSVAAKKLTWDDIKDWPESAGRTEIVDGELVMSPPPATKHQRICSYLGSLLFSFVTENRLGEFLTSAMHVILDDHVHYEPDLCFIRTSRAGIVGEVFISGPPDLIIEVISESNRTHDTVVKFRDYAKYGVSEYWLVDPRDETINTWTLDGESYALLGRSGQGEAVVSRVLTGLSLDPGTVFDYARTGRSN
jgi:Uma2 family endonuclease